MTCPECGYKLNVSEKQWRYSGENCYDIHSQLHHESIFKEIVDHYIALPDKAPDWDTTYIWIIIDEFISQTSGCSTCFIQSHRVNHEVEKRYREKNIKFSFVF